MLNFMLDTNICIYVMKRKPISALEKFNQYASRLCVSSITAAELYFGAENSQFIAKNLNAVDDFLSRLTVLDYDLNASTHYGNICAALRKQGQLLSENDMHIAAHARSQGLVLVTNNSKEFVRVAGLRLDNWV
ncbi:type II toxin-antitoxin system tRNA(fMet)-specific endonuclease VapC [Lonepinella sp. BR2271]|uniref:type II toxin-antitoxin system tRNA(fMet)-specific endonuclease VapC n=1 Tax=Lonepinella sp. BR2271 TaxID=3434550 RepID=UPI003F6E1319